jgi:ribosomal protein S18 acetylase RimI-like enzyme
VTDFAMVDLNLQECFRALAAAREKSETRRIGGIHVLSLGVRFRMFNAAYLASPVENDADFDRRIATATVHFGARGLDWSLWLCDSLLPEQVNRRAHRILARRGLDLATHMPGMIASKLEPETHRLPRCEVQPVEDAATLRDFCAVGSRCFRVPQDWFDEVFDARTAERVPFRAWVGYVSGNAAATAATIAKDGVLGIYNVATLPDFRRQGYGEGIVRECVERESAVHGRMPIVLQSTASGLSLYERMGFEVVTRFRVWVS